MAELLKTTELLAGDVVRCVGGRDDGKLLRVSSANGTPFIGVDVLTKDGRRDRRYLGWSGHYDDCEWELIRRDPAPEAPSGPRP